MKLLFLQETVVYVNAGLIGFLYFIWKWQKKCIVFLFWTIPHRQLLYNCSRGRNLALQHRFRVYRTLEWDTGDLRFISDDNWPTTGVTLGKSLVTLLLFPFLTWCVCVFSLRSSEQRTSTLCLPSVHTGALVLAGSSTCYCNTNSNNNLPLYSTI